MLRVEEIVKSFIPGKRVLDGVSTQVRDGEIACLLGPSGCGKTTLLRIIAGLESADTGRVYFGGEDVTDRPVHQRQFGLMFQDYALFPHMSVAANVGFGLRMAGWDKRQRQARVDEMLELVNLSGYGTRSVDELSGGEQQRVALARTLAPSPRLLMLDEPLANLDRLLREELVDELRTILKRVGVATVFVTHDQTEAFALADQVVVMRSGHIEQEGSPQSVHQAPANAFVAGFLGFHNLLPGRALPDATARSGWIVQTSLGQLPLEETPPPQLLTATYCVLLRPDAAVLAANQAPATALPLDGQVIAASFRGGVYRLQFAPARMPARLLTFEVPTRGVQQLPSAGSPARLYLDPRGVTLVLDEP